MLWLYVGCVLTAAGAPFVAVMALARRWSERTPRVWRDVGSTAGFGFTAAGAMALSRELGIPNGTNVWVSVGIGSLWGAGAVLGLTGRWWPAGATLPVTAGAVWVFFAVEAGTHGPWYIRDEMLALLASVAGGALVWHAAVLALLGAWARRGGRRSRRIETGRCVRCGYDLSGVRGGRCPECAAEIR